MTHDDVIQILGGASKLAEALGCHHSQPVRWKVSGIPPRRWRAVVAVAAGQGRADITLDVLAAHEPQPAVAA